MKKVKQIVASLIASAALLVPTVGVAVPALAQAGGGSNVTVNPELCRGVDFASPGATGTDCAQDADAENSLGSIIETIINILSIIVGAISVIMIIVGGLRYIVSAGDSAAVGSAKNTILYAIVGLIIVIFAQTIVRFVVSRIT